MTIAEAGASRIRFQPGRLWSLLEVMRSVAPRALLKIGEGIEAMREVLTTMEQMRGPLSNFQRHRLLQSMSELRILAGGFDMPVSAEVLDRADRAQPQTVAEFETILTVIETEVGQRQVFFVAPEKAKFFEKDDLLLERTRDAFPNAASELREAANAYAAGLNTGCVFHCARAAEIGTRALAKRLGCKFDRPLDEIDLHPMLEQCEKIIKDMKNRPRGATKTKDVTFYSQAAFDFRLFKDAYRVHVAHARVSYTEGQALSILERSVEFFDALSERLKEPKK